LKYAYRLRIIHKLITKSFDKNEVLTGFKCPAGRHTRRRGKLHNAARIVTTKLTVHDASCNNVFSTVISLVLTVNCVSI